MFSDDLLGQIFMDERMHSVPLEHHSTVLRVVQDVINKRYYTERPDMSREDILKEICEGD